jgi:hypothetical protein
VLKKTSRKLIGILFAVGQWIAGRFSGSRAGRATGRPPKASSSGRSWISKAAIDEESRQEPGPRAAAPLFMQNSRGTAAPVSPIVASMERRALRQIFNHLGLSLVPSEAFVALEQTHDPVTAFARFSSLAGTSAESVRDRVGDAYERMTLAVDLLFELAPLRGVLTDEGRDRIFNAIGDTGGPEPLSALRSRAEQVTAVAQLQRIGDSLSGYSECSMAAHLVRLIGDTVKDPLAADKDDIEIGIEAGYRLEKALTRLATLQGQVASDLAELQTAHFGDHLSSAHAEWCDAQAEAFDRHFAEAMLVDSSDTISRIEELVEKCEVIRDSLAVVRERISGEETAPPPLDEPSVHLAALGFPSAPRPTWSEVLQAFRDLVKVHNTDDPGNRATEEQEQANKARMQEIIAARDYLKRNREQLADA